jgi:Family of unknown function (DUF6267)
MISYSQYLEEAVNGKNTHLEHIEDEIFNAGVKGASGVFKFLSGVRDMLAGHSDVKVNVTTKWDGAPAIFAGIDPKTKKFFVGTKGVFAKNPKLNFTDADIDRNHPSPGLASKLKLALKYLPELGIRGVVQGDMMFTQEDIKYQTINGEKYLTFQPNTILYAVPQDSKLAQSMKQAKIGIVWHTTYTGTDISDMKASFTINVGAFNQSKNVWFRDASFVDVSGTAIFTLDETKEVTSYLSRAGTILQAMPPRVMNEIASNDYLKIAIKTYNNAKIREGQMISDTADHVAGLIRWVENKLNQNIIDAKRADTKSKRQQEKKLIMKWYKDNAKELKRIFDFHNAIVAAKTMIIKKLQQARTAFSTFLPQGNGMKVTDPEGFVAVDHLSGDAIKLVDRLEFSQANFNAAKSWTT